MEIKQIAVVGAGTMGSGIANVCALTGREVELIDISEEALDRAISTIQANLDRQVKKEAVTEEEKGAALGRIRTGNRLEPAQRCQVVIEAILEEAQAKFDLFHRLHLTCPRETILASNTSSISITEIAAHTDRADRVIGMHFFNPVPLMGLVELIRGLGTSDETFSTVKTLAQDLGKTPVEVNDFPGFVSNRILMPMINEAVYCLMEGVAGRDAIDQVMKLGMNHPMGPLALADFIGLDVVLHILEVLHQRLGDPKYRPCPLLRKMVAAGQLGRKSGRGFYQY